jgi:hypothetical protein
MTAGQELNQQGESDLRAVLLSKEIKFGVLGSVVGMLVMDLVMIVEFSIMGLPLDTYWS